MSANSSASGSSDIEQSALFEKLDMAITVILITAGVLTFPPACFVYWRMLTLKSFQGQYLMKLFVLNGASNMLIYLVHIIGIQFSNWPFSFGFYSWLRTTFLSVVLRFLQIGNMVRPTSVKDVDQDEAVTRIAHFLKPTGKVPEWSDLVKLGVMKDMALVNQDWYYIRAASLARRLYFRSPLGSPGPTTSALVAEKKVEKSAETPVEPAKPAASVVQSTTKITEVFDFGDEIKIEKEVTLEEAKAYEEKVLKQEEAAEKPVVKRVGLGDALTMLAKKPKMSVLDKSNLDWKSFKQEQKIDEDMAIPNSGKDGCLNKQDFLLKADHAQFEKERAMRDTIRKQNQ